MGLAWAQRNTKTSSKKQFALIIMISKMRIKQIFFENHGSFIVVFLLLTCIKLVMGVTSGEHGDATMKMRCRDNERQALLKFKKEAGGKYGVLSSWGSQEDCCIWEGIQCSNRTGHVIILDLHSRNDVTNDLAPDLPGKVSPSLVELKHLRYLDLSVNFFDSSPIPEFLGLLSKLEHLNLASARFSGRIPHQLGNLSNLRSLDLGFNEVLTVKNLEWLSHLRLLRYLDLSRVDLEKTDWLQQIHKLSFLTELHLFQCELPGTMSLLLPLTNNSYSVPLAIVDLSGNNFISPSSYSWLFNLNRSLVELEMSDNFLIGSIPEAFGSMVSLKSLRLSNCQLEGEPPISLQNLSHLKLLDLSYNHISGQLFGFFQNGMNSLEILNLDENKLSGSLPDLTRLSSLRELSLSSNELNGSFPKRFGQISSLVILDFSNNKISGSFPNLTFFPSLEELYLNNNQLQGTVSEAYLSNLSKLKIIDLSFNSLALEFSFDWDPPFQLNQIKLASCNLGTRFPKWLQSQKNLSFLDISGAGISDSIPNWFWDLQKRLEHLNISSNQIQGVIPDLSKKFVDYAFIDLSSNHFHGPIPLLPPNMWVLDLSKNMFTGSVSFVCASTNKKIFSLDVSDNQLSGELPDCWTLFIDLFNLNLGSNKFSGEIPTSMGLLYWLEILELRNNSFTGELPSTLNNCTHLKLLDLSENKLSGEVPTWIGTHLPRLIVFSLRNNEFFGRIPRHICYLSDAQVLDLSQNYISGDIPICLNNLTSMLETNSLTIPDEPTSVVSSFVDIYMGNAWVQWKGKESAYRKTLGLLKLIDLSSNKLAGKIPEELASLDGLISLNLSVNNLTGNIIQNIGKMKMLESLDLSKNQLSGDIPTGLASLTLLSVLDLSNNNFTGKIPSSTQLQGFNASVYAGNEKLCGLPLPIKCPGDELNQLPPPVGHGKDENNEDHEDKFVTLGFCISVLLGFPFGFWGFFGPILLRRTWRRTYFNFLDKTKDWIYVTASINMAKLRRKLGG